MLLSCSAPAERAPDIVVADGWAREAAPGQTAAAVYLTVANRGDGKDRLVEVRSAVSKAATLHSSSSEGGIARMRPIDDGVAVPPRSRVLLKPGGTHIMLSGLKRGLDPGQRIGLDLQFARSGQRSIAIRVVPATAADDPAGHGQHR